MPGAIEVGRRSLQPFGKRIGHYTEQRHLEATLLQNVQQTEAKKSSNKKKQSL